MECAVISREPYLLLMIFSRHILIGKIDQAVIKIRHPYGKILYAIFLGRHIGMRSVSNADYLEAVVSSARLRRNANLCIHVHVAGYRLGFAG